jgi:hypothetical protein
VARDAAQLQRDGRDLARGDAARRLERDRRDLAHARADARRDADAYRASQHLGRGAGRRLARATVERRLARRLGAKRRGSVQGCPAVGGRVLRAAVLAGWRRVPWRPPSIAGAGARRR